MRRALAFALLALIASVFASAQAGDAARAPLAPTFDAILDRTAPRALRVRWLNHETLIAEMAMQGGEGPSAEIIPIDGAPARRLVAGPMLSPSPVGGRVVSRGEAGWRVQSVSGGFVEAFLADPDPAGSRFPAAPPEWSRDGRFFAAAYASDISPPPAGKVETRDGVRIVDVGAALDAAPAARTLICVFEAAGSRPPRCVDREAFVRQVAWTAAGDLIFVEERFYGFGPEGASTALKSWRPGDPRGVRELTRLEGRMQSVAPAPAPNDERIAIAADVDSKVWDDFVSLLIVDPETRRRKRLTSRQRVSDPPYVWDPAGEAVYFAARRGGFDEIWRVDITGDAARVVSGARRHFDLQRSPDGRFLSYQTEDGRGRRDIRLFSLATGAERVVRVVDDPARDFRLGAFEQIDWTNGEGDRLYGFLVTPPDFDPTRRHPMLVDVHGGGPGSRLYLAAPLTISIAPGPLEWHAWAALGYVVFVPDYRSTGSYGPAGVAARYCDGDFAGIEGDAIDIESGVRAVIAKGFVDPARIAAFGHSAGGARVNLLTTRTHLFAAAIINEAAGDPIASLISSATGAAAGQKFEETLAPSHGARLAEAPARYLSGFLFDGWKSRTPTLIMVGGGPGAAPPLASEALYSVLRQYGIRTRMIRFVDEGHVFESRAAARLAFDESRRWLEAMAPGN